MNESSFAKPAILAVLTTTKSAEADIKKMLREVKTPLTKYFQAPVKAKLWKTNMTVSFLGRKGLNTLYKALTEGNYNMSFKGFKQIPGCFPNSLLSSKPHLGIWSAERKYNFKVLQCHPWKLQVYWQNTKSTSDLPVLLGRTFHWIVPNRTGPEWKAFSKGVAWICYDWGLHWECTVPAVTENRAQNRPSHGHIIAVHGAETGGVQDFTGR